MPHDWVKTSNPLNPFSSYPFPKWKCSICESKTYNPVHPDPNQKTLIWLGTHMIEGTCEELISGSVMDS